MYKLLLVLALIICRKIVFFLNPNKLYSIESKDNKNDSKLDNQECNRYDVSIVEIKNISLFGCTESMLIIPHIDIKK